MQVLNDVTKLDSCCTTYVAQSYFLTSDYSFSILSVFFYRTKQGNSAPHRCRLSIIGNRTICPSKSFGNLDTFYIFLSCIYSVLAL